MRYQLNKVVWEITWKCNANCIHCGSDCISQEKEYQLTTAECLDIVADLGVLGAKYIFLSGGDPLCRKDFPTIAAAIKNLGMNVGFISNAIGLNEDTIKLIKAINPIVFGISIDAADAWMHDYIRGHKGCFEHLVWAIKELRKNNIETSVVTTLHKLNYSQLPKIRDLLLELGVELWQIQYADFIGRMPHEAMITEAQYWAMAEFMLETRQKYKGRLNPKGCDVTGYMSDFAKAVQGCDWYGCQAGIKGLGICSDGTIRGCLSQQMDQFIEGNVRETSLVDLWNDPNKFQYNRHFDCSMLGGYCKDCLYGAICKGGCALASSCRSQDGKRCNPYCLYKIEKEGYSNSEQARTDFTKDEIAKLYDPVRKLPNEFWNSEFTTSLIEDAEKLHFFCAKPIK